MLEPVLPDYLNTSYAAKRCQRGGTLIAEDVWEFDEHRERVLTPCGYRPDGCPSCQAFVQGHGCRYRRLRDQPDSVEEMIRRYRCNGCEAVWQVLPAFLARHLHRTWGAIQSRLVSAGVLARTGSEWRVRSIPSTLRRWSLRLGAIAIVLTQAFAESNAEVSSAVVDLGAWCSRSELVEGLADAKLLERNHKLGDLAGWIHRLTPGIRVM